MEPKLSPFDGFVPLTEAAKLLPKSPSGKSVSTRAVYRWASKGLAGGVRLRTARLGHVTMTRPEWLAEFAEAVAEAHADPGTRPIGSTPVPDQRAAG